MATIWLLVVVGGPLLLFAALIYGIIQYRKRDRRLDAVSDASARQVRDELAQERRDHEHTPPQTPPR